MAAQALDVRLIRRIDDAVMAVVAAANPAPDGKPAAPREIPATDTKAVKAMLMDFAAFHKAKVVVRGREADDD